MLDRDPQQLKQFLFDYVESHEALQILMWLQRHGGTAATGAQIAQITGISPTLVAEALGRLAALGLLSTESAHPVAFRYNPSDPALDDALQGVVALYEEQPLRVIEFMTANSIERVKASALRRFADAFQFKKPPQGGSDG